MNLAPITESPGISLMMKMGWSSGQGLGKEGTGDVNPLQLSVKTDRKGLYTNLSFDVLFCFPTKKVDVDWFRIVGAATERMQNNWRARDLTHLWSFEIQSCDVIDSSSMDNPWPSFIDPGRQLFCGVVCSAPTMSRSININSNNLFRYREIVMSSFHPHSLLYSSWKWTLDFLG